MSQLSIILRTIRIKNWEEINSIIIRMEDFSPGIKGIKSFLIDIEKGI